MIEYLQRKFQSLCGRLFSIVLTTITPTCSYALHSALSSKELVCKVNNPHLQVSLNQSQDLEVQGKLFRKCLSVSG